MYAFKLLARKKVGCSSLSIPIMIIIIYNLSMSLNLTKQHQSPVLSCLRKSTQPRRLYRRCGRPCPVGFCIHHGQSWQRLIESSSKLSSPSNQPWPQVELNETEKCESSSKSNRNVKWIQNETNRLAWYYPCLDYFSFNVRCKSVN